MNDLHGAHTIAADNALAECEFEPNFTIDAGPWDTDDDRNYK
jgi:hypothetical protein